MQEEKKGWLNKQKIFLVKCPNCKSNDIQKWGIYISSKNNGTKQQRYKCRNCGHVFRG